MPPRLKVAHGFSLVELLIAIAVVAILAVIAFPSYQAYSMKGRRSQAQAFILDVAQRQQQFLLDSRTYAADVTSLNLIVPSGVQPYYSITIDRTTALVATPQPAFTVTAQAIGAQSRDGNLQIDSLGNRLPADKW